MHKLSLLMRSMSLHEMLESGVQVFRNRFVITIPDTSSGQKCFTFLYVNDSVLTCPIVEISKQEAVNLTQSFGSKF